MQQIITLITDDGKEAFLAKIPYSLEANRNLTIQRYNLAIDELVDENSIGVDPPPDFYNYFEINDGQFSDTLHPNGEGYQGMADLWVNALP